MGGGALTSGERRIGRPRDPACDAAIQSATLEAFADGGYRAVSIEGVAARSGVAKATIYRRYANKAQLLVDAIRGGVQLDEHLPDTGDLRADLRGMLEPLAARLRGDDRQLLIAFAVERVLNRDLADEFDRAVVGKKREHLRHIVRSARQRGELAADADIDLIAEAAPALIWHHALNGLAVDDDLVDRILALVLPAPLPGGRREDIS
jgi:AcrR family transcriptional regulator